MAAKYFKKWKLAKLPIAIWIWFRLNLIFFFSVLHAASYRVVFYFFLYKKYKFQIIKSVFVVELHYLNDFLELKKNDLVILKLFYWFESFKMKNSKICFCFFQSIFERNVSIVISYKDRIPTVIKKFQIYLI